MSLHVVFTSLAAYMLVFSRVGGMILFNPLLSRRNIPAQVKIALILGITLLLTPSASATMPQALSEAALVFAMVRELLVGVACGFIFQVFYYLLFTAGDVIDMGFGLSMAKAFDPGTNIQMSMSGNLLQLLFVLYLFATNSHLILIRLMASSYELVGMGAVAFGDNVGGFLIQLFTSAFSLVMQLALPFVAASFVLELSMGILMKLIPQINVFSIHFQFKILFGLLLLFAFAGPTAQFMEQYMHTMFVNMQNLFGVA